MSHDTQETHQPSRYQRVQEILDQAAGESTADYQGFGPFWRLPYDEFIGFEIYKIPLFGPFGKHYAIPLVGPSGSQQGASGNHTSSISAQAAGCCPSSGTAPSPTTSSPGRGAQSGLVRGLRGEFPFDGSHFPSLPWGGSEVSAANIRFIESWIEDGYPESDDGGDTGSGGCPGHQPEHEEPAPWRRACPPHPDGGEAANTSLHRLGQPKLRKNYECLSEEELCKLRFAVRTLKELDRYSADNRSFSAWARVHGDHCQHGWEQFLPWHRAYLYKFELALQQIVPDVTLPYWDWTLDSYHDGAVPKGKQSGIIPTPLRCWLNDQALHNLRDHSDLTPAILRKLMAVENQLFNSTWELFRQARLTADDYKTYSAPVVAQLENVNPLWHPYRYPGMFYPTDGDHNPLVDRNGSPIPAKGKLSHVFHHHYPGKEDIAEILGIAHWGDFGGGHFSNQSFGILEQNPHNTGHIWVGGQNPFFNSSEQNSAEPRFGSMFNDLVAFFDPVGYAHHANIDRLYREWQKRHPGLQPDDPTAEMVPFHLKVEQLFDVTKLGYDYARDVRALATDSGQEIRSLSTEEAGFVAGTLEGHRRVELSFHNLRRPIHSHAVRVFLNLPGADANTSIVDNDHYVGYFARFGHGDCVGGPGHCDPPSAPVSRFELQPRHHNTPHNHRLDATDCVTKLAAAGAQDLTVQLVVVDGNGGASEGLRMDGISIHIID